MIVEQTFPSCHICYSQCVDGDMIDAQKMSQAFQLQGHTLFVPHLLHTSNVIQVPTSDELWCDALTTTDSSLVLGIRVADCLPIVISVPGKGIALVHGGWRSLLDGVLEKTIQSLLRMTKTKTEMFEVWIGPSLQKCCNCMETKPVQWEHGIWKPFISQEHDGYHVDLQAFVVQTLEDVGVKKSNILHTHQCTYHQKDEYFSYRRYTQEEHGARPIPHMGVVAWIKR